jgi:hydrogenase maturation protease
MNEDIGNVPRILVLGIGNELCGDDGFGPAVVKEFSKRPEARNVSLENGATLGLNLVWLMEDYDVVLVADAVLGIGYAGDIKRIEFEKVECDSTIRLSLHEIGLAQAVDIAEHAGWKVPKIIVFGVEPKTTEFGIKVLSEEIARAVPTVAKMISEEIQKLVL